MKKNLSFAEEMARAERKEFIAQILSIIFMFALVVFIGLLQIEVLNDPLMNKAIRILSIVATIEMMATFILIAVRAIKDLSQE